MEPGNQWFVTGSADRTIKVISSLFFILFIQNVVLIVFILFLHYKAFFLLLFAFVEVEQQKKKEPGVFCYRERIS